MNNQMKRYRGGAQGGPKDRNFCLRGVWSASPSQQEDMFMNPEALHTLSSGALWTVHYVGSTA